MKNKTTNFILPTIITLFLLFIQTNNALSFQKNKNISYLALGDSYTIGESVKETERWPVQLANQLNKKGFQIQNPKIIATTGWRTDDLLKAMDKELNEQKFDIVSVLIGVNNQYQGKDIKVYEKDLHTLFKRAIKLSKKGKKGVFVLSIPDYGATPFGKPNAQQIGKEIDEWNNVYKKITEKFGLPFYNITMISKQGVNKPELVAKDGLHPSGKMYGLWVEEILEKVVKIIQ